MFTAGDQEAIRNGAPEATRKTGFRPNAWEEIIPYIGTTDRLYFVDMVGGFTTSSLLYPRGPSVADFYLGSTVRGESGEVRRNATPMDSNNEFSIASQGLVATVVTRRNILDRTGGHALTGVEYPEEVSPYELDYTSPELKELLAKAVFNVLNPSVAEGDLGYLATVVASRDRSVELHRSLLPNINPIK